MFNSITANLHILEFKLNLSQYQLQNNRYNFIMFIKEVNPCVIISFKNNHYLRGEIRSRRVKKNLRGRPEAKDILEQSWPTNGFS